MLNRRLAAVLALPLLSLAACGSPSATAPATPTAVATPSAGASASPSAGPSVVPQSNLDAVSVTGGFLSVPKVDVKAPFGIDKTRAKVLVQGKGAPITEAGLFTFRYYLANGTTGKKVEESFTSKANYTTSLSGVIKGFTTGLLGQKAGSRVLLAIPGAEGYDAQGGSPDGTIKVGDTLVFVVDIVGASVSEPQGVTVKPSAGLPTVTGGPADKPTITMPGGAAPSAMSAVSLIQGSGPAVAKGDTIMVRYVGYSWKTGKLIDDQWTPSSGTLSSTIPGWQTGLLGKKAGSRVLLVLPPADGFPKGSNNPPLDAGDTIVYVVDLLYTYSS